MHRFASCLLVAILVSSATADPASLGLRVPPGFEVTPYSDSSLANDIYCLTINPKGEVVVSGRGYIRILVEDENTGKASSVLEFADAPKDGAMGLHWEGDDLYAMGAGGLRRYSDANGAGRSKSSELLHRFRTGGEHHAHAIRRGPDGCLYVLVGNMTGVPTKNAVLPTSPIRDVVAGSVIRFFDVFSKYEVVTDGFRNAYGMDFNSSGDLFVYDSDNERCVSLPWYEGTRCYHAIPGGHCGWLSPQLAETWRKPPHFVDIVKPLADLGRGSPTGVTAYRHEQFPEKYRDGLFLADWTFGRIYFLSLRRSGASYEADVSVFIDAVGDNGFAPTGLAVHPTTGDLFVSVGGRGTRGAVYRIRHKAGFAALPNGRGKLSPMVARNAKWSKELRASALADCDSKDLHSRRRALETMHRFGAKFEPEQRVQAIRSNWGHPDRYLRQAVARLIQELPDDPRKALEREATSPRQRITLALAFRGANLIDLVTAADLETNTRLEAVRALSMYLGEVPAPKMKGGVWEGYTPRKACENVAEIEQLLLTAFPTGDETLDSEVARCLALIGSRLPKALVKIRAKLTETSSPISDFHNLIVYARLGGKRTPEDSKHIAHALCLLDEKLTKAKLYRDRWWPIRLRELHRELAKKDPALSAAILNDSLFGAPSHVVFAKSPGFDKKEAAGRFLKRGLASDDYAWDADVLGLLAELPEKSYRPVIGQLWGETGLDSALLALLSKKPNPKDRNYFIDALSSANLEQVRRAARGLTRLPKTDSSEQALALLLAWRSLPKGKEFDSTRSALREALRDSTAQKLDSLDDWLAWFRNAHPASANKLDTNRGIDAKEWADRLAKVDWDAGDVSRGEKVFAKAQCAACHSGARALGPDLRGVTTRFSRDDLFTSILDPNKEVPPRYRSTLFETTDGKVYQGVVIYQAVDSVILQTGPTETIRLKHPRISQKRTLPTSLMPAGLLDKLSARELADLYAYLRRQK